jgi:superfamily I DNA/RNA helicase
MLTLAKIVDGLNSEQKRACLHKDGPLLVLAGAGTGKTKVIVSRIAALISQGIEPSSIVALSFTNKAAREMGERLQHFVGKKLSGKVLLSTFHSFALNLLRRYAHEAGLADGFGIASESVASNLIKETLVELKLADLVPLQDATQRISLAKDGMETVQNLKNTQAAFQRAFLAPLFDGYNRRLRLHNLIDFDDIVYLVNLVLKTKPQILQELQNEFLYFLVDEYQDTSSGQLAFINALGGRLRNVCVVGDDDQSIYSWRGARSDAMLQFLNHFKESVRVSLEQNYRCPNVVLKAANSVIANNTSRLPKNLWSQKENFDRVRIHAAENERDEAEFVLGEMERIRSASAGTSWDQFAILVRSNGQTDVIEKYLLEKNVPTHVSGGKDFMDRKEVLDLFSYLKFAANPRDLSSALRIVNVPPRRVGVVTMEKWEGFYRANVEQGIEEPLTKALEKLANEHEGLREFAKKWDHCAQQLPLLAEQTAPALASWLKSTAQHMGLFEEFVRTSPNPRSAQFRSELVEKTLKWIGGLQQPLASVHELVSLLHLDTDSFSVPEKSEGKVQIMTIHASKGLEFPNVFVVGAEEGLLPHEKCALTEEERRLFYVAMTRCKERLFLSRCAHRSKGRTAEDREPKPSRFLSEIPPHLVSNSEVDPAAKEAKRMHAAQRLFDMFR